MASENADTTAQSQYYRPYYNYYNRPNYYTTGYNNRRPFYPARPSYNTNYQQRPVYNNRPTYNPNNNNLPAASAISYPSPQPSAASTSNSQSRVSCTTTSTQGTMQQWGACWDYQEKIFQVSKSRMTPESFGHFYKYMSKTESFATTTSPEFIRSVCQVANLLLNNKIVMCASEDTCVNEHGRAYQTNCYNDVCVCLIDDRIGSN